MCGNLIERRSIIATLYQRLGGADGITRVVDDVMVAHLANPIVKTRFENIQDIEHAKRMAFEFFCRHWWT
jgi:hemoglobin